jgi:glyoxylase-like metal-dependent hydrolase (beta-lactamase superfamily II)
MTIIHTYTAGEQGLFVNSYLLETEEGVILIDANLLKDDALALAARLRALHKPLLAAFVTHAHPDHFNGLPYVVPDGVPVYASKKVADTVARIAVPKREQWQPVYGDQWPDTHRVPDHPVNDGTAIHVSGIEITVCDLGEGESHADSVLLTGTAAFTGDVAFGDLHAYTADGHTEQWLANLDRLVKELDGRILYPGHGVPGGVTMLHAQRRYLLMYREAVRRLAAGAAQLTDSQRAELDDIMRRFLPDAPLTWMIGLGADAVTKELAAP